MSDETWVVALPKLGESVTEGVIGAIFKQVGDEVEFDDALFEVSTDKVDSEIPSPYDGVVLEVLAQPGETVPVGAPVLRIGGPGATVENRLPWAFHAVAAAGGRSLAEPSAPSMGGSEGPAIESGAVVPPGNRHPLRAHHAEAGRIGHRGHHRLLVQAGGRHGRIRRRPVRGVDRQGRFGDPQPLRRHAARDPGRQAKPFRSARCWPASAMRPRTAAPPTRRQCGRAPSTAASSGRADRRPMPPGRGQRRRPVALPAGTQA